MRKTSIQFDSPVDALVALTRRLAEFEIRFNLTSEDFFDQFTKGRLDDSVDFTEWANDYRHYLTIRRDLVERLQHAA